MKKAHSGHHAKVKHHMEKSAHHAAKAKHHSEKAHSMMGKMAKKDGKEKMPKKGY